MEKAESDWADERIDNSRAFGAVWRVLMLRSTPPCWFLRAGDPSEADQWTSASVWGLLLLQRPCQSSVMSPRGEPTPL